MTKLKVTKSSNDQCLKNRMYINRKTYSELNLTKIARINDFYYSLDIFEKNGLDDLQDGYITMSDEQRKYHKKAFREEVEITICDKQIPVINSITMIMECKQHISIDSMQLSAFLCDNMQNTILNCGQILKIIYDNTLFILTCAVLNENDNYGIITADTTYIFITPKNSPLKIINNKINGPLSTQFDTPPLFNQKIKLSDLGVGGLNDEFETIFRRAFASRSISKQMVEKFGICHVKGILLHGPLVCGKTLLARTIGKILNCVEPKIVAGPSLLDKYIGESEANVRKLFEDAVNDKNENNLHLIICDEFDSIAGQRGTKSGDSGVSDRVVNALLAAIDGPNQLNNILLICMSNRIDLIDDAILRAGRLEVHIEITLPDEKGRHEILNIHTRKIRENELISPDVEIKNLAHITINYTGAEIESLVKIASGYAIRREITVDGHDDNKKNIKPMVTVNDFELALTEINPMFGKATDEVFQMNKKKFIFWSNDLYHIHNEIKAKITNLKNGFKNTFLINGPHYIGKTKFIANLINDLKITCVKVINPEKILKHKDINEYITKCYLDCTKANSSILFLDSIERLIEYSSIGCRYNNVILQTILAILNADVNVNKKIIIFITSTNFNLMEDLEIIESVDKYYNYPNVINKNEIKEKFGLEENMFMGENIVVSDIFKMIKNV